MDWSCSISALVVVLVFAVLLGPVTPQCSIDSSAGMVYLKHSVNSSSLKLLAEPPSWNDINGTCQEQQECCMLNNTGSNDTEFVFTSLDDALWTVENFKVNESSGFLIALLGNGTLTYRMQESHVIANLTTFIFQSINNSSSVSCNKNVSLSLNHICSISVQAVSLIQCGSLETGSLAIKNALSMKMMDVLIQASAFSGVEANLLLFPPFCDVSGLSSSDGRMFLISNSTFTNNGQQSMTTDGGEFYGGGVNIITSVNVEVSIVGTKFIENNASIGAGLAYSAFNNDESFLYVINCEFIGNHANIHGGAAHLYGMKICVENSYFTSNSAAYTAGAIYQFIPLQVETAIVQIKYSGCYFDGNYAQGSACLAVASSLASFFEINYQAQTIDIINSVFSNNKAQKLFFGQTSCVIHSDDVFLNFKNTVFLSNSATSVCAQSSMIILSDTVEFKQNTNGYLGGAINTIRSLIKLLPNTNVLFQDNQAVFGGAIYEDGIRDNSSSICLFDFPKVGNYSMTFRNNYALSRGHSIYYYAVNDVCLYEIKQPGVMLDLSQVTSGATSIEFHHPVYLNSTDQTYVIDLILGQLIVFNVTVLDFFNSSSFAQVNIILWSNEDQANGSFGNGPYQLEGFQHISIENGLNRPNLSIIGPIANITQYRHAILINGLIDSSKAISVNLKPCPLGFVYNETRQKCMCFEDAEVACDFTLAKSCIKKGYWIGDVNGALSVAPCASLYCQNNNENCSLCPITDQVGYCLLPQASADQCLLNRQGFLCSECESGFALTFGAIKCVKDSSCRNGRSAITVVLNVVFVIATITLLITSIKLDYRLSSGYLFGFIYYFSIIRHLLNPVIVGDAMLLLVSILSSVTQLNPQFLGYISICFSTKFNALQQQAFLYLNPAVISIFVLLVIGISRYFSKHIKFGDNTMVKAISLLLLLSFTALIETSFNILNPVQFPKIPGIFVYIEPSVEYLDPLQHLLWFLIAMLIVFLLVIPFTVIMVAAPLLSKYINLNKIKPFLDEFQSCYKDRFRWMAGYYFVARFIYLLILTAPRYLPILTQYIIQFLSLAILVIHMLLQPYKNKWMNIADSILLTDIVIITALFGSTAGVVFENVPNLRVAIVYILVLIPVMYLIVVIIVTNPWVKLDLINNWLRNRFRKTSIDITDTTVTHTSVDRESRSSFSSSTGLREPLLDMMDDDIAMSYSTSPTINFQRAERRKLVGRSIVERQEEDEEVQEHLKRDRENSKYRSPSISSQSWLSETSNDEEKLINKLL